MHDDPQDTNRGRSERAIRARGLVVGLVPVLVMGVLLLGASGDPSWAMAWIYLGVHAGATAILAATIHPDLIEERSARRLGAKAWDRRLVPVLWLLGLVTLVVAGLDHRYHWTAPFPVPVRVGALSIFLVGHGIVILAGIANRFFSGVVRIQEERGHHVIATGPYARIRHPGYLGLLLCLGSEPLIFNSLWALVPCGMAVGLLVVRTSLEDRTLRRELHGYQEYCRRVRFRLVPGIW
jgi:protein-S-isoprenylcysteine O-methyltransferase Ste14